MSDFSAKIRAQFTSEELETYVHYFEIFDLDGDGAVSAKELHNVSSHMGYQLTNNDIKVGRGCYINHYTLFPYICYILFCVFIPETYI